MIVSYPAWFTLACFVPDLTFGPLQVSEVGAPGFHELILARLCVGLRSGGRGNGEYFVPLLDVVERGYHVKHLWDLPEFFQNTKVMISNSDF